MRNQNELCDCGATALEPFLSRRRWILFPICCLTFVWFAFFSVDIHHDGVMLLPAMDVADGAVVFRDTFSQYGILTPVLQGLVVKLFGAELLLLRLLTVACYGWCAILLDKLYCRFLSQAFRWVLFGLFLGLAPFYLWEMHSWPSVYALGCMLLGAELMLRYLESGRLRPLFFCGLAAAAAFGFRQPCGLVMMLAGIFALALEAWCRRFVPREWFRRYGWFLGGCGALLAVFTIYLTVYGAWTDYLQQTWGFAARFMRERSEEGNPLVVLSCLFPFRSVFVLLPLVSLGMLGWMLWRLCRTRDDVRALLLASVLIAGLASWHQYAPVPCIRHLYWGGIPMLGAFVILLEQIWQRPWRKAMRIGLLVLLLAWPASSIGVRMLGAIDRFATLPQRRTVTFPHVRWIWMEEEEAAYYENIARSIQRIPAQYDDRLFLNLTPHAIFGCFFSDRPGFRPMYVNWQNNVDPDYARKAMQAVEEFRPLVLSISPSPFPGYRPVGGFPEAGPYYYLSIPPEE